MRAGFGQFKEATPELNAPTLPSADGRWQLQDLVKLRLSVEQNGLKLSALENVPT